MPLHPMMQMFVDATNGEGGRPDFVAIGPVAARAFGESVNDRLAPGPAMARTEKLRVAGYDGAELDATLLVPPGEIKGLLVFLHGGGWVVGSTAGYIPVCQVLAAESQCAILSVDYRLAPEHPFPVPAEDCYAATQWAAENCESLLGASLPLVVGGDSAGGNLAAVVALMARDRGGPALACQLLIYPATDCDLNSDSYQRYSTGGLLPSDLMRWFWDQYIADEAARANPLASCLRAESLAGLPHAMVEIAVHDPLRSDGEKYAERLAAEGVPVTERHWHGLCHGFFQMATILPPAGDAARMMGADLKALLDGQSALAKMAAAAAGG
jgi:acetyl esterase